MAILAAVLVLQTPAYASLTLQFDGTFSNPSVPAGSAPWLTITFEDSSDDGILGVGEVRMTIQSNLQAGSEFFGSGPQNGIFLNVANPHVTNLTFAFQGGQAFFGVPGQALNGFRVDGDGEYDIHIEYDGGLNRLTGSEQSVYLITSSVGGLSASSFDFLSFDSGPKGPFKGAAHVQGLTGQPDDSVFISAVPEPMTFILATIGLLGLTVVSRRLAG